MESSANFSSPTKTKIGDLEMSKGKITRWSVGEGIFEWVCAANMSVPLYGAEMWRVTTTDLNKLDVFHRTCLRRVLRRFCLNYLSNEQTYEATGRTPMWALILVRRWRWIGHVLRTSTGNIWRTALTWAPEGVGGKRRRGWPRETRRTKETSWDGIRGGLLSLRRQTGVDGAIFWPAPRVLIGPMGISMCYPGPQIWTPF